MLRPQEAKEFESVLVTEVPVQKYRVTSTKSKKERSMK